MKTTKKNKECGFKKVQVGKDQEKEQSEKDSHSKNRGGKKKTTNNQVLKANNIQGNSSTCLFLIAKQNMLMQCTESL